MPGPPSWLPALHQSQAYPHAVGNIELVETHLSWVFLTGQLAYKLKKPIALGFVDFSTLEKREAACREELRLNRRTVPGIYEEVVTLVDTETGPRFGVEGPVFEYAVRMRQFPQSDVLLAIAESGGLTATHIEHLAKSIAAMHEAADVAPADSAFGRPATVRRVTEACLPLIAPSIGDDQTQQLEDISGWVRDEGTRLESHFVARRSNGFIRECHGDLHLGNIVLVDGIPQPFDCLEFNAELRFIDVISDLAFLVMDLLDHGLPEVAWQVLNGWLDQTGDFAGLAALQYYEVYRALVRAKVAAVRLTQPGLTKEDLAKSRSALGSYLDLASRLSERGEGGLVLMHGFSGSGKSVVGRQLACQIGAVCLRSDRERKRSQSADGSPRADRYSEAAIADTYGRLLQTAETLLRQGHTVLVDATFLKQTHRRQFYDLAKSTGVPWLIVSCEAPQPVLEDRIQHRQSQGHDPSEATLEVLRSQRSLADPLTGFEQENSLLVDTSTSVDGQTLKQTVISRLTGIP